MGVKFLLTYIKDNEILQKVELSLLAGRIFNETGKKPKLLCDFFNLRDWFWVPPVRALIKSNDYPEYSSMYGGDFHLFADRVQCFVAALNHIGIEPVFFVDGPRGSDDNFEGKISILKQRSESRLHSAEIMQRVCEGTLPTYEFLHCHDSIMSRQLLMTLLKTDAKVVFCRGEADPGQVPLLNLCLANHTHDEFWEFARRRCCMSVTHWHNVQLLNPKECM